MNAFDVVVPTYNNVDELKACLDSLEGQTNQSLRILVCVDGSTDGTGEYLETRRSRVPTVALWHEGRQNRGRAATRNLALPVLDSSYTLFLDSDMALHEDGLAEHAAVLSVRPSASVGAIRYANASDNLWAKYKGARRLSRWPAGSRLPPSQFITANASMYTSDFLTLGGFDERFRNYGGEDTDLGFRLWRALDRPIVSNPAAFAVASELKTLAEALEDLRTFGRSNLPYLHAKHPDMPHVFRTDKLGSRRLRDRAFMALMNPLTDLIANTLLRYAPFSIQEQLINYKVVRSVFRGYAEGSNAPRVGID
jgi:glycosyltransferase involved in cell wall biosynthesis